MAGPATPSDDSAQALRDLVAQCLDALEAGDETAVEEVCARHPEFATAIRARIARLRRAGLVGATADVAADHPERLGDFTLVSQLGHGGMGVVYRARQESLGREVALKLIHPLHLHLKSSRARFRREVALVARLQHPGVVPVYAVGEEQGIPYFAMELVPGCSLADALGWLAAHPGEALDGARLRAAVLACVAARGGNGAAPAELPELFTGPWSDVCMRIVQRAAQALEYAHRQGVVHRDVKPSNLMLTPDGRVLLLDFGVASAGDTEDITRTGAQLGSLPYLAPEQVRDQAEPFDARSDVYGLGVTLYELLTLRRPFSEPTIQKLLAAILAGQAPPPRQLRRDVARDAETICQVAMERDRQRRYASAADLARDLDHALRRRPIAARRAGPLLHLLRWIERSPGRAAALLLLALILVGAPVAWAVFERRSRQQLAEEMLRGEGSRLTAQAFHALQRDPSLALLLALEGHARRPGMDADNALQAALQGLRLAHVTDVHQGGARDAVFRGDGARYATAGTDGVVRVFDCARGQELLALFGHEDAVTSVQFAADGKELLTTSADRTARLWDAERGSQRLVLAGHRASVRGATPLHGGRVLTWADDGALRVFGPGQGEAALTITTGADPVLGAVVTPDQELVLDFSRSGPLRCHALADGRLVRRFEQEPALRAVALSPDGTRVAFGGSRRMVFVADVRSGELLGTPVAHDGVVVHLAFSPDGARIASATSDHDAHLFDLPEGRLRAHLVGHTAYAREVAWSPDGRQVASTSDDRTPRLWRAEDGALIAPLPSHSAAATRVRFAPDGQHLLTVGGDVRLWRTGTGRELLLNLGHRDKVLHTAVSGDGRLLATGSYDGTLRLWALPGMTLLHSLEGSKEIGALAFDAAARRIAAGDAAGMVRVWDVHGGAELGRVRGGPRVVRGLCWSQDEQELLCVVDDNTLARLDWQRAQELERVKLPRSPRTLAYAPAAARVAVVGVNGMVVWCDLRQGLGTLHEVAGSTGRTLHCAAFDATGQMLVVGGEGGVLSVLRLDQPAAPALHLPGHESHVHCVSVSPDGSWIATGGDDLSVRLWDAATGAARQALTGHAKTPRSVVFLDDGRTLVSAAIDGSTRRWPLDPHAAALALRPRTWSARERSEFGIADATAAAQAEAWVQRLSGECVDQADLRARIDAAPDVLPAVRALALQLANARSDAPAAMARLAARVVERDDANREEVALALRRVRRALELAPGAPGFLRLLALALVRNREPAAALAALAQADAGARPDAIERGRGLLVATLAQLQAGQVADARAAWDALQAITDPVVRRVLPRPLYKEVETRIGKT